MFSPSNIVAHDGWLHAFVFAEALGAQRRGACLMRTRDMTDPTSWRAWDGRGFAVRFADPYAEPGVDPADSLFGRGEFNSAYEQYFVGNSYLKVLNTDGVFMANVTFEPGCHNNWHVHHEGGQVLLCTDGEGWYQEWGQSARKLVSGDVVYIAPEVKHWHGAAKSSWFTHVALEIPADGGGSEWLEAVDPEDYDRL